MLCRCPLVFEPLAFVPWLPTSVAARCPNEPRFVEEEDVGATALRASAELWVIFKIFFRKKKPYKGEAATRTSAAQCDLPTLCRSDEIYNLACPASQLHYQMDPVQTAKNSVSGVINMLGLAKRPKVRILSGLHFGALWRSKRPSSVRGLFGAMAFQLLSCYDEGKRCAETLFFESPWPKGL